MDQNIQQFFYGSQTDYISFYTKIEPKPASLQMSINFNEISKPTYSLDSRKNLELPDTLSISTPPELLTRKITVEIPQKNKFNLAKNETSPRLECKYAVKTDIDQSQINNL